MASKRTLLDKLTLYQEVRDRDKAAWEMAQETGCSFSEAWLMLADAEKSMKMEEK